MNHWRNDKSPHGPNGPKQLPASAAADQLAENLRQGRARVPGMHLRASLDSAMTMQMKKQFETSDLFHSLNDAGGTAFPEISWTSAEDSESNLQRLHQAHAHHAASTGHLPVLQAGFSKMKAWPSR